MNRQLREEYFENKQEQNKIRLAILQAIPEDVYYHNLIIVLAELLGRFTAAAFEEEVLTKSTRDKEISA